ncbi:MAG: alkaline phosphatase [Spirochaetales bacterium]|nr:alkaline phosphatase [Spirochaetales bacterium]
MVNTKMKKLLLLIFVGFFSFSAFAQETKPKYVFYFIGDGLGPSQRQLAEYYLQEDTADENAKLLMNSFPNVGVITSHSADTFVTDSAAGGTALATGYKTNNGVIGKDANGNNVRNIFDAAKERGWKTGIVTTTRLTHATPASFYAHNIHRDNENEMAIDLLNSNIDFFAGGGWRHLVPGGLSGWKSKRGDELDILEELRKKGYMVFAGPGSDKKFKEYQPKKGEKIVAALTASHLPYEIDRIFSYPKMPSLAELTQKAVDTIGDAEKGFIIMVEAGRIDHACHINDPVGTIYDTLALDNAIKVAMDFYNKHPNETLIIVGADHETGGASLGFGANYFLKLREMENAKISVEDKLSDGFRYTKETDKAEYIKYLEDNLALTNMTARELAKLGKAMELVDSGAEIDIPYGYDPVAVAAAHILSERMNIQWTTFVHTGTQLTVSAIGSGSELFCGFYDNTMLVRKIAALTGLEL